jgi:hypothetical protein
MPAEPTEPGYAGKVLESLPEVLRTSMAQRNEWRRAEAARSPALEFLVSDLARWVPGSVVRVGFLDGDDRLHRQVAETTDQITDVCNLTLDFGLDPASGEYRRWRESDTELGAEIRVSFDQGGYWSLVGTDSSDPTISDPAAGVGGGPGERSLNLEGFTDGLPPDWPGTVRHEFLHALAFQHEHQNPRGPCENELRWDDDPGYVRTTNAQGVFVPDSAGRRPGIYTYLSGPPNDWSRATIDHNLRTHDDPDSTAGPFDPESVMLYRFEPFFYKSADSDCAPDGDGINLSVGDIRGVKLLYPTVGSELADLASRGAEALHELTAGARSPGLEDLESASGVESAYAARAAKLIGATVDGLS